MIGWLVRAPFVLAYRVAVGLWKIITDPDPQTTRQPSQEPAQTPGVPRPTPEASTASHDGCRHCGVSVHDVWWASGGPGNGTENHADGETGPAAWYGHPNHPTAATTPTTTRPEETP